MDPVYHYKPRVAVRIEVPKVGDRIDKVTVTPGVIAARWTRNNHLVADELTLTVGWEEGGCDPRLLKNATCEFYMWDSARQTPDGDYDKKFLRFVGVCVKASRKLSEDNSEVTLTFHDYTSFFLRMKPYPTAGMPKYSDTLQQIWERLCDHTGFKDPDDAKKIVSSVAILRDRLRIVTPMLQTRQLGFIAPPRFHAIAEPSIHHGANAWEVWQWCCGALGAVSYIQEDECIVMTTTEHYGENKHPKLIYGKNILEFEENSDTSISGKGVLLKSWNPLTRQVMESYWPPPGDDRLKLKRSIAKRAAKAGRPIELNDITGDYDEFTYYPIQTQEALDFRAKEAYEEYSRQQMDGTLKTMEMVLEDADGSPVDILGLFANDSITIGIDNSVRDATTAEEMKRLLMERNHYNEGLARIVSQNFGSRDELTDPTFHVTSMDVDYADGTCSIEIKFHNLVNIKGLS